MVRKFVADGREFPVPNPALTVDEIKKMLGDFLPELLTADVEKTVKGEEETYTFKKKVGTKG